MSYSGSTTYIWTAEGWLYLAGVKDLYTKELVGYAVILPFLMDRISRIKCSSMAAYHRWLDEAFHDYRTTTNGWHNPEYHLSC